MLFLHRFRPTYSAKLLFFPPDQKGLAHWLNFFSHFFQCLKAEKWRFFNSSSKCSFKSVVFSSEHWLMEINIDANIHRTQLRWALFCFRSLVKSGAKIMTRWDCRRNKKIWSEKEKSFECGRKMAILNFLVLLAHGNGQIGSSRGLTKAIVSSQWLKRKPPPNGVASSLVRVTVRRVMFLPILGACYIWSGHRFIRLATKCLWLNGSYRSNFWKQRGFAGETRYVEFCKHPSSLSYGASYAFIY